MGDPLDDLLNSPQSLAERDEALRTCFAIRGEARELADAIPDDQPAFELEPEPEGIVASVIASIDNPPPPPPEVPARIESILFTPFEHEGKAFEGCVDFAATAQRSTPEEQRRTRLQNAYVDEVGSKAIVDERWVRANSAWASCMDDAGYGDLSQPGDELELLRGRIDVAGSDVQELTSLIPFEESLTAATQRCVDKANVFLVRVTVRQDLESTFVSTHEDDIRALVASRNSQESD